MIFISADSLAVDLPGNCYVTGWFQYAINFGGTNAFSSSGNGYDTYIAKYDTSGKWQWTRQVGSSGADYGRAIALDWEGNCHVAGDFSGTATFGTDQLTAQNRDPFLVKFGSSGDYRWVQKAGGSSLDQSTVLALDSSGSVFLAGTFRATALFGTNSLTAVGTSGDEDIFLTKLQSTTSARPMSLSLAMYAGLTLQGTVGRNVRGDYVNDVSNTNNWQILTNFALPGNPYLFFDLDSPNWPRRYYRAVEIP